MTISLGSRSIGQGEPCYVIAEMSGNHGGDLEQALEIIRAAHAAGADAIKIQVYRPDTITLKSDKEDFRIASDNAWARYNTLYELYEYAHTPWEWLGPMFEEAERLGIELFGSVFDETSVDALEQFPVRCYKIASPEIVDTGLLAKVAKTGKPVIVSTGLADIEDIHLAIETLKEHGCNDVVLLKCSTAYPTPPEEVNIRTIPNMRETFQCEAGLSDHSVGIGASIAAVALGASVIEKHIKMDGQSSTVDDFFSLSISEFKVMVEEIRRAEQALGAVSYDLTPEVRKNMNGRRSLYVSAPISQGETFREDNIKSVRPGYGLAPKHKSSVLGRKAACDLDVGDRLSWDVIE